MDTWRYYDITHATHDVMNPTSTARLDLLGEMLRLRPGMRVLDVGCGHAELLLRWSARHGMTGVGVDASPYHAARARARVEVAGASSRLEIVEARGEDFATDERFDVACCVGASWIWGGHAGTLRALMALGKPGGAVVTGEPFWRREPPEEYLRAEGMARGDFHSLAECHEIALGMGLELTWMAVSSGAEWDDYEMRQCASVDAFAGEHPEDPDVAELRRRRRAHDAAYIRWGRECLGWALWAFRVAG